MQDVYARLQQRSVQAAYSKLQAIRADIATMHPQIRREGLATTCEKIARLESAQAIAREQKEEREAYWHYLHCIRASARVT